MRLRVWLKCERGNNCQVAAVYSSDCETRSMAMKRQSKHKFKRFFHGWQEEKTASFCRYFQVVANWIWKEYQALLCLCCMTDGARSIIHWHWRVLFVPDLKLISNDERWVRRMHGARSIVHWWVVHDPSLVDSVPDLKLISNGKQQEAGQRTGKEAIVYQ